MPGTSFTPIDRAHREFSEEQIRTSPSSASSTKAGAKVRCNLVDRYFAAGMDGSSRQDPGQPVPRNCSEVMDDDAGKQAVGKLVKQWAGPQQTSGSASNTRETRRRKSGGRKNKASNQLR